MRCANRVGRHVILANGRVQRVEIGVADFDGDRRQQRRVAELLDRQAFAPHRLHQFVAAIVDRVVAALAAEPLTDLVCALVAMRPDQSSRGTDQPSAVST